MTCTCISLFLSQSQAVCADLPTTVNTFLKIAKQTAPKRSLAFTSVQVLICRYLLLFVLLSFAILSQAYWLLFWRATEERQEIEREIGVHHVDHVCAKMQKCPLICSDVKRNLSLSFGAFVVRSNWAALLFGLYAVKSRFESSRKIPSSYPSYLLTFPCPPPPTPTPPPPPPRPMMVLARAALWHNILGSEQERTGSVTGGITAHSSERWVYFRVRVDKTGLASQWIPGYSNSEVGSSAAFDIWNVYKSPSVLW